MKYSYLIPPTPKSNPQPVEFTVTHLCPSTTNVSVSFCLALNVDIVEAGIGIELQNKQTIKICIYNNIICCIYVFDNYYNLLFTM